MNRTFDLLVIGGGPAGLQATIYAASEGLSVAVVNDGRLGGQIRRTPLIENLYGIPGVSGAELTAQAEHTARLFGAEFFKGRIDTIAPDGREWIGLCGTGDFHARSVLVATGMEFRRIPFEGNERAHFGPYAEDPHGGSPVVVGGGNSAGQFACWLSETSEHVTLVARSPLEKGMSRYLIQRLDSLPNVRIKTGCVVDAYIGQTVHMSDGDSCVATGVHVFAGSRPTAPNGVPLTEEGVPHQSFQCLPGVFVAGDARAGSVNRVAVAAGDGGSVVPRIHRHLTSL